MRALIAGLLGAVVAASLAAALPNHQTKPVPGQDKALDLAFRTIREHRLLPRNYMRCFSLTLESKDARKIAEFTARESHKPQPPRCNGDPGVAPRLFSLEIDMQTGKARWDHLDAEDDAGNMRPVPRFYINPIKFEFDKGKSGIDLKKLSYTEDLDKWLSENRKHDFDIKAFTGGEDLALVQARADAVNELLATRGVLKSRRHTVVMTDQYRSGVAVTGR